MRVEEKLIEIMRREGKRDNPPVLLLGEMEVDGICNISGQRIEPEDYYIAEHLTEKICKKAALELTGGTIIDKSIYIDPIKEGDTVLLYEIVKNEKYVIIEKVV